MGEITLNGIRYWQPECHCKGTGHICYLRPMPTSVNTSIEKIIKATSIAKGNQVYGTRPPQGTKGKGE